MDDSQKSNESKLLPKFLGFVCPAVSCFCVVEGAQNMIISPLLSGYKGPGKEQRASRGAAENQGTVLEQRNQSRAPPGAGVPARPVSVCHSAMLLAEGKPSKIPAPTPPQACKSNTETKFQTANKNPTWFLTRKPITQTRPQGNWKRQRTQHKQEEQNQKLQQQKQKPTK